MSSFHHLLFSHLFCSLSASSGYTTSIAPDWTKKHKKVAEEHNRTETGNVILCCFLVLASSFSRRFCSFSVSSSCLSYRFFASSSSFSHLFCSLSASSGYTTSIAPNWTKKHKKVAEEHNRTETGNVILCCFLVSASSFKTYI